MNDQVLSDESTPPSGPLSASDSASSSQGNLIQSKRDAVGLSLRLKTPLKPFKSAANTSATLDGLPEELLKNVVSFLASQTDLFSLCCTAPRYSRAALPHLYSKFQHEMYKRPRKLHSFLRSVIKNPNLGEAVDRITLKDQQKCKLFYDLRTWRDWAAKFYKPTLVREDIDLFADAARELQLQQVDALDVISTQEEAQAALLLSRCPNLTELSLTLPNIGNNRLLLSILKETTDRGTALQKLRRFEGIYYNFDGDAQGGFELAPISSLFRLPKMTSLYAIACLEPEDDAFRGFDCELGTSSVTDIEFRRSSVCPKAMSLMVGACRALRRFYCDWGGHTVGWSEINFPTIGAALRLQGKSLQSLTLDVKKHYHTWPEAEEVLVPPLGSFANFECLERVDVPGAALIGWDEGGVGGYPELYQVLPASLKTLKINQWAPGIADHLDKLSDVVAVGFPNLLEVWLEGPPDGVREEELQKVFDSKGAQVRVHVSDIEEVDHFD